MHHLLVTTSRFVDDTLFIYLLPVILAATFSSHVSLLYQEGLAPINLVIETDFHRASPGGTGGVKTIGNYAAVILVLSFSFPFFPFPPMHQFVQHNTHAVWAEKLASFWIM